MEPLVAGPAPAGPPLDPVDEAMRVFAGLQMPELHRFLRRCGLTVGGTRLQRLHLIAANLRSGGVATDTAFDFLDETRESGEQHLFLFRLGDGHQARLADLRDDDALLDALATVRPRPVAEGLGDREAVRQGLYEPAPREALFFETAVDVEGPRLVAAYWRGPQRRELFLKWVEKRRWEKLLTTPRPERRTFQERAIDFFHVDLEDGRAELRLQRLHPAPERSLEETVGALREQLAALLGGELHSGLAVGPFVPVTIEPAMRRLLTSEIARVVSWQVDWIDSGKLGGGVDPALAQCLFRRHRGFSALRLSAEWLFERPGGKERKVPVQLDGRTNEVAFPKRCTAAEMQVVLGELRHGATRPLRVRELQELRREDETTTPILLQIERELGGRRAGQKVDLRRLARESWFDLAQVVAVAERLADRSPEAFTVRYRGRCEETGNLAELPGGKRLEVGRWAEVPDTFQCLHTNPRRFEQHAGDANVEAALEVRTAAAAPSPLQRAQPRLVQWFGASRADRLLDGLAVLGFAVLYVPAVMVTALGFLAIQRKFADGGVLLTLILGIPLALAFLLEAGAIVAVLGDPLTSRAQSVLGWVISLLDRRTAADDDRGWRAKVHRVPAGSDGKTTAGGGNGEGGDADDATPPANEVPGAATAAGVVPPTVAS
jgi:hypothetical protein